MSGRYRTVALQAVGVAAIAAIIFIAFLRPDEPGDLSGIDAPGGEEQPVVSSPPDDKPKKSGKRGNERGANDKGPSQGSAGGNGERNGPGGTGTSDEDDTFDGDTPPDDQYDDLVTRLLSRVGEPAILREMEPGIKEMNARP
ncbi:MAG TPA: hypothetical protein VD766_06565 [Solirubrobacterales bacterium]|nr:hypothetical protein [Solirubrobacterales bacterium]